jgi:hypothetical protein
VIALSQPLTEILVSLGLLFVWSFCLRLLANSRAVSSIPINDLIIPSFVLVLIGLSSWILSSSSTGDSSIVTWLTLTLMGWSYQSGLNLGSVSCTTGNFTSTLPRYGFLSFLNLTLLRGSVPVWTLICWMMLLAVAAAEKLIGRHHIEAIRFSWLCKVKTTYESNYGKWLTVDIVFRVILPYTILVSIGAFRNAEIDRVSRSSRGDRRSTCCIASIAMRIHGNYGINSIQFSIK